jgi:hypothetical protein
MSRYISGNYAYGYDHPLQEYFIQENKGEEMVEIVGCLSNKPGSAGNFLIAVEELGIEVPKEYLDLAVMDLPF